MPTESTGAASQSATVTGLVLLDDAMAKYRMELEQNLESAQKRHGFTLYHSLTPVERIAHLKKLGFEAQDGIDHYNLGCVAAVQGNFEEAAAEFAKAAKDTEFFEAVHNWALALEKAGKTSEARGKWSRALELAATEDEREGIRLHLAEIA